MKEESNNKNLSLKELLDQLEKKINSLLSKEKAKKESPSFPDVAGVYFQRACKAYLEIIKLIKPKSGSFVSLAKFSQDEQNKTKLKKNLDLIDPINNLPYIFHPIQSSFDKKVYYMKGDKRCYKLACVVEYTVGRVLKLVERNQVTSLTDQAALLGSKLFMQEDVQQDLQKIKDILFAIRARIHRYQFNQTVKNNGLIEQYQILARFYKDYQQHKDEPNKRSTSLAKAEKAAREAIKVVKEAEQQPSNYLGFQADFLNEKMNPDIRNKYSEFFFDFLRESEEFRTNGENTVCSAAFNAYKNSIVMQSFYVRAHALVKRSESLLSNSIVDSAKKESASEINKKTVSPEEKKLQEVGQQLIDIKHFINDLYKGYDEKKGWSPAFLTKDDQPYRIETIRYWFGLCRANFEVIKAIYTSLYHSIKIPATKQPVSYRDMLKPMAYYLSEVIKLLENSQEWLGKYFSKRKPLQMKMCKSHPFANYDNNVLSLQPIISQLNGYLAEVNQTLDSSCSSEEKETEKEQQERSASYQG